MLAEGGEHGLGVVGGGAHLQRVIFGRGLEQWRVTYFGDVVTLAKNLHAHTQRIELLHFRQAAEEKREGAYMRRALQVEVFQSARARRCFRGVQARQAVHSGHKINLRMRGHLITTIGYKIRRGHGTAPRVRWRGAGCRGRRRGRLAGGKARA